MRSAPIPVILLAAGSRMLDGRSRSAVVRALRGDDRGAARNATGVPPLSHVENCAGTAARRPSRNRRAAETDSCRQSASVWSNPVAPYISAASASTTGTSCARCSRSRSPGSESTRPSKASFTSNSERISPGCVTGWRSQSLAACSPLAVASSCERASPRLLGYFSAAVIRPSWTSRGTVRHGLLNGPDLTKTAVFRQQARDCEAVRRLLANQAEHHPFGQRKPRPARPQCDSSSRPGCPGRLFAAREPPQRRSGSI
jgi:hypothetical protein